jgi:predicted GNAT family acetyltransferase
MQIEHRLAHHRFVARLPEGDAILAYRITSSGAMDIRSTYVPALARGRGTGGALVEAALTYARANGHRVIPTCWYVSTWIAEHPEFQSVLTAGASGSA